MHACVLPLQELLLSKCMAELTGQAGTACCERGYVLHVLWQALRRLLAAVLNDRDASRTVAKEARKGEAAAVASKAEAIARIEGEKAQLSDMNE